MERNFKGLTEDGQPTPEHCRNFIRAFQECAINCINRGNLTKKQASVRFIFSLPLNLRNKAVYAATRKGGPLDVDKMHPFAKIYAAVEAHLNSERDLNAIAEEQGISSYTLTNANDTDLFANHSILRQSTSQPAGYTTSTYKAGVTL